MDDSIRDRIERFAVSHCGVDGLDARELCRAIYQGEAVDLPMPTTEFGRTERAALASIIAAGLAHSLPQAVAKQPASPSPYAAAPTAALPELTGEARAVAIRAMAGPDLSAMAEALIAGSASVSDAHNAFTIARAHARRAGHVGIAERAAMQIELGGSYEPRMSRADTAGAGWKKAFAKAEAHQSVRISG